MAFLCTQRHADRYILDQRPADRYICNSVKSFLLQVDGVNSQEKDKRRGYHTVCKNFRCVFPHLSHLSRFPLNGLKFKFNSFVSVPLHQRESSEGHKCGLSLCRPVMHNFFLERFAQASDWFEKRLAYTRSVATSSMVSGSNIPWTTTLSCLKHQQIWPVCFQ